MTESFATLFESAKRWARQAHAGGWIGPRELESVERLESASPQVLFDGAAHRPLVTAFFGGTGVGKSTLLNRLAGEPIAATGVVRPTSREVTVYAHASVTSEHWPPRLLDRVRIARHDIDQRREILWIDMPDFDSVERANRDLALGWLPYIDVLIYVVSPERYRDDRGWRLLQAEGHHHAWVFVINHWDRGHPAQFDDFADLLRGAGFSEPLIFRTDSRDIDAPPGLDEFDRLRRLIEELAHGHILRQLENYTAKARLHDLDQTIRRCIEALGADSCGADLATYWEHLWLQTESRILHELEWPVRRLAQAFVGRDANLFAQPVKIERAEGTRSAEPSLLWDAWSESRVQDAIDRLIVEAGNRGVPILPLKAALDGLGRGSQRIVWEETQQALRQALANPGHWLQRWALRTAGFLSVLLPLAALGWVSFEVVKTYYDSTLLGKPHLGIDFAIHSGLLIVLAWLSPFFVYRKLRPSSERVAVDGLKRGLRTALERVGATASQGLAEYDKTRRQWSTGARQITERCRAAAQDASAQSDDLLARLIPKTR